MIDAVQFAYDNFFRFTSKGRELGGAAPHQVVAHCLASAWNLAISEEESIVKRIVATRQDKPRDLMGVCCRLAGFKSVPDVLARSTELDSEETAALAEALAITRAAAQKDREAVRRLAAIGVSRVMSAPRPARLSVYNALFISEGRSVILANFDLGIDPGSNRIEQRQTAGSRAYNDFICSIALAGIEEPFILVEFGRETLRPSDLHLNLGGPVMTISGAAPEQIDARQVTRAARIAKGHDHRKVEMFLRLIEERKANPENAATIDRQIDQLLKVDPFDDVALEETRLRPSGRAFSLFRHLIQPAPPESSGTIEEARS